MASFADDLADIARPRSMEYVAGMVEGNERGANAQRLARLIAAVRKAEDVLARQNSPYDGPVRAMLRAALAEARQP